MKNGFTDKLKSRSFAGFIHACLWVLLYLVVTGFRGRAPEYRDSEGFSTPAQSPAPVAKLDELFSPEAWSKIAPGSNTLDPFFTTHFIPNTPPVVAAPTTRKIELTYQGYYQNGDGLRQTMVKFGDAFIVTPIGHRVASNLFVADASMQTLTLTNPAAQTNVLPVNVKKEIEVPLK
jgi:hypothetical protein